VARGTVVGAGMCAMGQGWWWRFKFSSAAVSWNVRPIVVADKIMKQQINAKFDQMVAAK